MKLKKRDCKIKVNIEPLGAELLYVCFDFGYDKIEFTPSTAAMSNEQFGEFVCALYTLYVEKNSTTGDSHDEWHRRRSQSDSNHKILATTTIVDWDGEGSCMLLEMTRKWNAETILLRISKDYGKTFKEISVDDKEFCYAVAKACTEALKEFGFYGYRYSTESEPIKIHQLLFLKAYALENMEARELIMVDEDFDCRKSDFNKELELLLFDM